MRTIWSNIKLHFIAYRLKDTYDHILIINPYFIRRSYQLYRVGLTKKMISDMKSSNAKIYQSACGEDYIFFKNISSLRIDQRKYFNYCIEHLDKYEKPFKYLQGWICKYIPTHYEYAERYRIDSFINPQKIAATIPLPIILLL